MRPRKISKKRYERIAQALNLRKTGMTYQAIADTLGTSKATAIDDVRIALNQLIEEPATELVRLETARLDMMQEQATEIINDTDATPHQRMKAIETALKIMHRRATLLGLDKQNSQTPDQEQATAALASFMSFTAEYAIQVNRLKENDPAAITEIRGLLT